MVNKKRKVSCGQERKKRESPPNTFTTPTPVFQVETVALHRISFLQFPQSFGNGRIGRNGYAKPIACLSTMTALSFSLTQLQYFVTAAHTLNLTQARGSATSRNPRSPEPSITWRRRSKRNSSTVILHGGSWGTTPWNVRSADRYGLVPNLRYEALGFRLA